MKSLKGVFIPAVTPFFADGRLDLESFRYNCRAWGDTDVSGLMCLGTNGEARMLNDSETIQVIEAAAGTLPKEKCLIAGVGRESLYHTLEVIDRVQSKGIRLDYFSVLTPHYYKKLMDDRALIEYYTRVADFSGVPILLYCAPTYANGVCVSIAALRVLAEHPNIAGIKDTSPDMMDAYLEAVGHRDDFTVMSGSINSYLACVKGGGSGGIVSAANYFPRECAKLDRLFRGGDVQGAEAYYLQLKALVKQTGARGGVAGVKCAMNAVGLRGGYPRLPILPMDETAAQEMRLAIEQDDTVRLK